MWKNLLSNTGKLVAGTGTLVTAYSLLKNEQSGADSLRFLKNTVDGFNKEVLKHNEEILVQKSEFSSCVRTANDHLNRAIENLNISNNTTGTAKTEAYNKAIESLGKVKSELSKYEWPKFRGEDFVEYITNLINNFKDIIETLNYDQLLALCNILGCLTILFCLFSLFVIYYSDFLIKYFKLEERNYVLGKFILLRRKFNNYYFGINIFTIFIFTLILIIVNFSSMIGH